MILIRHRVLLKQKLQQQRNQHYCLDPIKNLQTRQLILMKKRKKITRTHQATIIIKLRSLNQRVIKFLKLHRPQINRYLPKLFHLKPRHKDKLIPAHSSLNHHNLLIKLIKYLNSQVNMIHQLRKTKQQQFLLSLINQKSLKTMISKQITTKILKITTSNKGMVISNRIIINLNSPQTLIGVTLIHFSKELIKVDKIPI